MAWTLTDLTNIETAIRSIIAGTRIVSFTKGDIATQYTAADLPAMYDLRDKINAEVALSAGTFKPRSFAKQGGRGI
jgi:pyruvate/2-oxoglutarate dehydrogenase complex dihydrolipoamide acyltransferase (E2) component